MATRDRALLLPVTLKSFEAVAAASGVKLNWVTTAERDNDFYEVEHSTDGINFTRMATISGQTESVEETSYAYIHEKPAGGAHYYRLSQQDFDGTRSNLGIRTVLISQAGRIGIFPNPATAGSELTLNLQANETAQPAQLYAITGNLIAEYSLSPGASTLSLPTNLSAGIYLLRMGDQSTRLLVK